ncbi:MAG: patatin-like phospholipase family protein [Pseudomonadota bacterium]
MGNKTIFAACAAALACLAASAQADDAELAAAGERPRIGLALSGGGARGAAHVGVLRALEDMRIPIDYIAGTSVGAIIGGLYAAGADTDEIERIVTEFDWEAAFSDQVDRADRSFRRKLDDNLFSVRPRVGVTDEGIGLPAGIVAGQQVDLLLNALTMRAAGVRDFDELPTPFRATATDIVTGKNVVLGTGSLAQAIRASLSIPAIFTPAEIDGRLLVDGGVSNNLPIDVVRAMGADVVIAVDISTALLSREQLTSVVAITEQLTSFLTRRNTEQQIASLTETDVLVLPDLGTITSARFDQTPEAVERGAEAAVERFAKLAPLALPRAAFDQHLAARRAPRNDAPVVDFLEIRNNSLIGKDVLEANLDLPLGQPLDVAALEAQIGQLYGLDVFENIRYDIERRDDKTGVVLTANDRSWGTSYLRFQLDLSDNFGGDNFFNLGAAFTTPRINRLGGELRVAAQVGQQPAALLDIYQLLDVRSRFFVNPTVSYRQRNVSAFQGDDVVSEFRIREYGGELYVGSNFGTWGELRVGARRLAGNAEVRIGDPNIPRNTFDIGEALIRLSADRLDNVFFPRSGTRASVEWLSSRGLLGARDDFDQLRVAGTTAHTRGKNTLLLQGRLGMTTAGTAPIQSVFTLGGFSDFSGFGVNELVGQHAGHLAAVYYRRIGDFALLPMYAGASLELGNVWDDKSDISFSNTIAAGSLFVGLDTVIGPISLAYGRAEGGVDTAYLVLGRFVQPR